jgi:H+/Cl- antiporter ClcA
MAFGRTKIITSFAFFGFILGTVAYFVFKWFVANDLIHINFPSISSLVMSPWFISGTIGALISTLILVIFSRLTS